MMAFRPGLRRLTQSVVDSAIKQPGDVRLRGRSFGGLRDTPAKILRKPSSRSGAHTTQRLLAVAKYDAERVYRFRYETWKSKGFIPPAVHQADGRGQRQAVVKDARSAPVSSARSDSSISETAVVSWQYRSRSNSRLPLVSLLNRKNSEVHLIVSRVRWRQRHRIRRLSGTGGSGTGR